jgi:integrase
MRMILDVAHLVDPRFDLLMWLGAELRLGQVARCRRGHLDRTAGTLYVPGMGNKEGTTSMLTEGQIAAAEAAFTTGYLAELEASGRPDYALFPGAKWRGGNDGVFPIALIEAPHVERTALRKWFRKAEDLAGIPHVKGRGQYGVKRAAVQAAKEFGISREGLMAHGGWRDTQMPDMIYADKEADAARREARDIRAQIRGEVDLTGQKT